MDNKQIIEEIFRIAKITQPIPEPDEDGIYDFEGIIIVPTTIAKKSVGGIKYNRNGYEIISQTPTWSYDSGPDVIEKSIELVRQGLLLSLDRRVSLPVRLVQLVLLVQRQ